MSKTDKVPAGETSTDVDDEVTIVIATMTVYMSGSDATVEGAEILE